MNDEFKNTAYQINKNLQKQLDLATEAQNEFIKSLSSQNKALLEKLSKIAIPFDSINLPKFPNLNEKFENLPKKMEDAVLVLANHGWYIDLDMHVQWLWDSEKEITKGEVLNVEQLLTDHFEENIDNIEKSIIKLSPARSHILSEAFRAHHRGEYYLSIPVFLSQADGIAKDIVGQNFFLRKDKKPKTALYVQEVTSNTLTSALLAPLAQSTTISASEYEREEGFNFLNRHMVLHGESLDYGNKTNSLKSISLINYISKVLTKEANKIMKSEFE